MSEDHDSSIEAIERARKKMQDALARRPERVPANPPPRYDEVYARGTALLNSLDDESLASVSVPTSEEVHRAFERSEQKFQEAARSKAFASFSLTSKSHQKMDWLQKLTGLNELGILRRALSVFHLLVTEVTQGAQVHLVRPSGDVVLLNDILVPDKENK